MTSGSKKRPPSSRRKGPAHNLGPDNLYADLGLPNADERLLKATLVSRIRATVADRKLTQAKARKIMNLSSEEVSDLVAGAATGFTAERLIGLLNLLGVSVSVVLRDEIDWKPGSTFVHFGREAGVVGAGPPD
jgi:predicted XRE-type DNA-binding protein